MIVRLAESKVGRCASNHKMRDLLARKSKSPCPGNAQHLGNSIIAAAPRMVATPPRGQNALALVMARPLPKTFVKFKPFELPIGKPLGIL